MIEMMLLVLAITLGPALGLYFLLGRPLKGLISLTVVSIGVARLCWLNPHANEKMFFIGLCWFCLAGLIILMRALKNPSRQTEGPADPGLNPAC